MYRIKELMNLVSNFLPSRENEFSIVALRESIEFVVLEEKDTEKRDLSHLTIFYVSSTINIPSQVSKLATAISFNEAGEEKLRLRLRSKSGQ